MRFGPRQDGPEADEGVLEANVAYYEEKRKFWQSLLDDSVADADDPLAALTAKVRKTLLRALKLMPCRLI